MVITSLQGHVLAAILNILNPNLLHEWPTFQYFALEVNVPKGIPYGQTSSVAEGPSYI